MPHHAPGLATGKGVVVGDFNSQLRIETTSTVSMDDLPGAAAEALNLTREPQTMVIEARWIGPCEPGQQAGDMIMPDGKVMPLPKLPQAAQ